MPIGKGGASSRFIGRPNSSPSGDDGRDHRDLHSSNKPRSPDGVGWVDYRQSSEHLPTRSSKREFLFAAAARKAARRGSLAAGVSLKEECADSNLAVPRDIVFGPDRSAYALSACAKMRLLRAVILGF